MKVLLLLRHADSDEKIQGQTDKERSLTSKGVQQMSAVAAFMKDKSLSVEKIIASTATRVRNTISLLVDENKFEAPIEFVDELYEADAKTYLKTVHNAGSCQSLLIAGHNPAITTFADYVSKTRVAGVGTANLLVFHFKGSSWDQLDKGECELMEHFSP